MAVATEIYNRMIKQKDVTRKDIIAKFMQEAKLTKAGARTYFELIKAKKKKKPATLSSDSLRDRWGGNWDWSYLVGLVVFRG
jgi:hypothetical protein